MKSLSLKRSKKSAREQKVLMGLIELYLETGKAVGSNTLKEHGFDELSSATIRNYCAHLEQEGYLSQPHTSGGRIPTSAGFRAYAEAHANQGELDRESETTLESLKQETKEVITYLEQALEQLSEMTGYAAFLSSPRFDHDFVLDVKLVGLDTQRILCVMITDFGSVLTEVLSIDHRLSGFALKRIEGYFAWRLTGVESGENLPDNEMQLAKQLYNEVMARYVTHYSAFSRKDLLRCGFSRLLTHPEFTSAAALANGLAVFESRERMHHLLQVTEEGGRLQWWIGDQLAPIVSAATHCAIVTIPYSVQHFSVGAVGLLGPTRMNYRRVFGALQLFSHHVSETLTKSLYKYRIEYRQPTTDLLYLPKTEQRLLKPSPLIEGKPQE